MTDDAGTASGTVADAATDDGESTDGSAYKGLFGAFPYAARTADSWLFRSYVVVAGFAAALLTLLFGLALIQLLGSTSGARFSIGRAFVILVGLGAGAPVVTPVLLVARTNRRGIPRKRGYEFGLALAGYLFLASLYGLVVAAMPETFVLDGETVARPPASEAGVFAPLVAVLYAIPAEYSLAVPTTAFAVMLGVHYARR
jgi:hypothetical protein